MVRIRVYSIDDFVLELKDMTKEVRLEALNEPHHVESQLQDGRILPVPALRFVIYVTAMRKKDELLYFTQYIGMAFSVEENKIKALADQADTIKQEITKKLADAGLDVKKGTFEQ